MSEFDAPDDLLEDEIRQPAEHADYPRTGSTTAARAMFDALPIQVPVRDDEYWVARDAELAALRIAQERAEAAKGLRVRAQALKLDSGFPERAVDAAMKAGETTAMAAVRRWQQSGRTALVLAGGVGAGKTTAAAWLALHGGGSSPAFLRAGAFEARGRYDKDLRNWLRGRTMLVIDDIGAEMLDGKGNFRALLDETLDMFYGDRRTIVMTTNLRAKAAEPPADAKASPAQRAARQAAQEPQFLERYGERVASRLFEIGLWAGCGNIDLRRTPLKHDTTTTEKD